MYLESLIKYKGSSPVWTAYSRRQKRVIAFETGNEGVRSQITKSPIKN